MRRLWPRLNTRRLMCAIAVLGLFLAWLVTRPYPIFATWEGDSYVGWSDGSRTIVSGPNYPKFRGNRWFMIVDWPDGSTSYYPRLH